MNHENPISVARYYSDKAKAHREFESKRLSELGLLVLVEDAPEGNVGAVDLLKILCPDRKSPFTDSHQHIAEIAFGRLVQKRLLRATRAQVLTKKKGPPKLESRWEITDAGRHNLATRVTGATARSLLDEIDAES